MESGAHRTGGPAGHHLPVELRIRYVNLTTSLAERTLVDRHTVDCVRCRTAVTDLFATVAMSGGLDDEPAPRPFTLGDEFRRGPHAGPPRSARRLSRAAGPARPPVQPRPLTHPAVRRRSGSRRRLPASLA